jgi:hypothetical protein
MAHMLASHIPNRKQYAVTFVVACTVLVRLTKVAKRDWSVGCRNNF